MNSTRLTFFRLESRYNISLFDSNHSNYPRHVTPDLCTKYAWKVVPTCACSIVITLIIRDMSPPICAQSMHGKSFPHVPVRWVPIRLYFVTLPSVSYCLGRLATESTSSEIKIPDNKTSSRNTKHFAPGFPRCSETINKSVTSFDRHAWTSCLIS